jgi:hypothetical protein
MDERHRATLVLIETAAEGLGVADKGKQLLQVARDYLDDGDAVYARTVLCKIDVEYFTKHLPAQAVADMGLAQALAALVEFFGTDLVLVLRPAGTA